MVDSTTQALIEELIKEDQQMLAADANYDRARTEAQLALRRYAAVRDYVTERLGESPYRHPERFGIATFPSAGRFRFAQLSVGDAVVAAFKEKKPGETMNLAQVTAVLLAGGKRVTSRAVNAALMRTTGIESAEEGEYRYAQPEAPEVVESD